MDRYGKPTAPKFPCHVCGCEIGWHAPSGVCSVTCLNAGQGFDDLTLAELGMTPDDLPDGTAELAGWEK